MSKAKDNPAALTAEKVAGQEQPVAVVLTDEGVRMVAFLNGSAAFLDEGDLLYTAPQQPAQSAELPDPSDIQGWSVTVNVNAQNILIIGHNSLSGIDNIADFAPVVRNCAEHLISFIGVERAQSTEQDERAASPTSGMTLGERIAHVGGRTNAAGYIEFGSVQAVNALVEHVLRDARAAFPQATATQPVQTEDERDAARYRWLRNPDNADGAHILASSDPEELDAAIDAVLTAAQPVSGGE